MLIPRILTRLVRRNQQSVFEVGHELMEIRDKGYYHDVLGYETFEAYCKTKWDFSRSYAYRLIESANVIDVVSPIGDIKPTTESQTRPLVRLPADQQLIAWQKAVETAPNGKVTARAQRARADRCSRENLIRQTGGRLIGS